MKNLKCLSALFFALVILNSCSSDDDAVPEPVLEEELITTVTVTLVPDGGGDSITLMSKDLDGDGPNEPEITVATDLTANTTYTGSVVFLNETEDPAKDITEEIKELDEEHQLFFVLGDGLDATTTYQDFDENDNPLGTAFSMTTGAAGSGTLTITLRHEPKKPNDGTLDDAGGSTDIAVTYPLVVQ